MKKPIPVNLDKKLVTLVMSVSLIGIGLTTVLSFHYSNIILEERVVNQLESESTIRADSIKSLLGSKVQQIQVIATDPMIRGLTEEFNMVSDPVVFNAKISERRIDFLIQVQAYEPSIGGSNDLENVQIVNKDGKLLFALINSKNKKDFESDQIFQRGMVEPYTLITTDSNGDRELVVATPIQNKEKDTIGTVIVTMNTQLIDRILLNRQGLGDTGESYLVNKDHTLLSESRFIENAAFNKKIETLPVGMCFENGEENVGQYQDYRGVMVFGASSCMDDLGLLLLVEIDSGEVFQPISSLREKIIVLGTVITISVGVIAYFLSKRLSRPIIKLKNAANRIAGGDFDVRTNVRTDDEIGQLSRSFDQMAEKIQDSLIKIKEREDIIKQQKDILLQFSQYSSNYCVCFVDIVGSTRLTSKLTDMQTSRFYSIFLNTLASVIAENGGVVVKNIGDALLYYFPKTDTEDVTAFENMLKCCMKVLDARDTINAKLQDESLPALSYRISSTFGPVRVAIIATSTIDDIFGSTVNICSKINSFAKPDTMVVGQQLYDRIKNVKGYAYEKIGTYSIDSENNFAIYSVRSTTPRL